MLPMKLKTKLKTGLTLKQNNQARVVLIGLVILIAVFIYYNQLYTSGARVSEALAAEFESKEALRRDYLARGYDDVAGLAEQEKRIRSQIENLHAEVPGYLDEPGVLVDIYRLVRENNLWAEKIVFDKYQEDNGFGRLPFNLNVDGNSTSAYRFIEQLEGFHRLVRVASVEFKPADGGWVSCRIRAEFYVLGEPGSEPQDYSFIIDKVNSEPAYNILKPSIGDGSIVGGTTSSDYNDNHDNLTDGSSKTGASSGNNKNDSDIPFTK